jgi:hypothetical protein
MQVKSNYKQMKKISYLVALIAVVLIFSGCGKKSGTDQAGDLSKSGQEQSTGSKVVNSIKDAMGLGQKMKCTYAMGVGENKFISTVWTEGKKYRGESMIAGKKSVSLFDGNDLMYNWEDGSATGTKISISCMKEIGDSFPKQDSTGKEDVNTPPEDLGDNAFNDAPEANCEPVASIDFSLPSNVAFTDQCAQLKTQMESIKKMQEGFKNVKIPGGANIPEVPAEPSL